MADVLSLPIAEITTLPADAKVKARAVAKHLSSCHSRVTGNDGRKQCVIQFDSLSPIQGPRVDSEEKREPASDADTALADSLKAIDPKRPIREADVALASKSHVTGAFTGSGPAQSRGVDLDQHGIADCDR